MGVQIMGRRWTEGDISLLKYCYYSADMSLNDIAKVLERNRSSVINKAHRLRVAGEIECLRRPLSDADRDFIRDNYRKYPVDKISAALGRSPGAITTAASGLGISKFHQTTQSDIDNIKRLAEEGLYGSQIARELKMSTTRVYRSSKRHKIKIRKATRKETTRVLKDLINHERKASIEKSNKI